MCRNDPQCAIFVVYNGYVTMCSKNVDIKHEQILRKHGAWIGVNSSIRKAVDSLADRTSDQICEVNVHKDAGVNEVSPVLAVSRGLESPEAVDAGRSKRSLTLSDIDMVITNCRPVLLGRENYRMGENGAHKLPRPNLPKASGKCCGISGTIRPDDYDEKFYAGDVVPIIST
ncbi:ATP-dependent RNA helicase-like protein DB10 isoform X2 [Babesia caballi]|uniref:ATP-dependent RNA helicase-like protein DB10 isoform X2 n=1 Tax=Babesia caballi TaxID=5871 RepID=A0AAV4LT88_BABCB|nr:ATP-dependent RNA helicase-like protein DB10 isoform X2 [Babesia caballi]